MKRARVLALGFFSLTAGCKKEPVVPKVALLLPESKTARYESQDWPAFKARLLSLGVEERNILYANANQDVAAQRSQAEAALANGATVMVLDPVDSQAAASIAALCQARNVPVIAYDRLIRGTAWVAAYISFDNEQVGRLQATGLLEELKGNPKPKLVMINGSPTDNNASMFKRGAHAVLDGHAEISREYDTPDWSPDKAQSQMQQALTALSNKVDGVLAANDGTAGGSIAALKAAGVCPVPPVTGQDAELAAIQRILLGDQALTIYKAIKPEAELAANLAHAFMTGKVTAATLGAFPGINGKTDNGMTGVPSALLTPVVVRRATVKETVIKDGFWKVEHVCTPPHRKACEELGLL